MMTTCNRLCGWMTAAVLMVTMTGWADGFRNPPEGPAALGKAGVKSVFVEDPSAISHNPATLSGLEKPEVMASLTLAYSEADFDAPMRGSAETRSPAKFLPNLYVAWPVRDGSMTAGIGITTPYGQSTVWEEEGALQYAAPYYAEMALIDINPMIAFPVSENLHLAIGLNLYWSELEQRQDIPWVAFTLDPTTPDGTLEAEGDGLGFGANLGLLWEINDKQSIGLTYRSPFDIEYEGDTRLSRIPAGSLPPMFGGVSSGSDFETEIAFPTILTAGYGCKVNEKLRVEIQVEWLQHSRYESLDVDLGNNGAILAEDSIRQDWDDTWTFGIGADYAIDEYWTVRGGYAFIESPIPDETFSPVILDSDRHVFAAGLGHHKDAHRCDIAYAYSIFDDRDIDNNQNPAFNGTYEINGHLLAVSYGYTF